MKKSYLRWRACVVAALLGIVGSSQAATSIQDPVLNTVGTGAEEWSYLLLEGEDFVSELNPNPDAGFVVVDTTTPLTSIITNSILHKLTTASKKAALYNTTGFGAHTDKVTYRVQFAKAGTYYLYIRFTVFESTPAQPNLSYLNEDSFFVPPDWNTDPELDWPQPAEGETGRHGYGGYIEGGLNSGFFLIPDDSGTLVNHTAGDAAGREFYEGNFHWNHIQTSEFLAPTEGTKSMRIKYEVTPAQVGVPLDFTVSNREGGLTIDAFLFATDPELMTKYKQKDLDRIILNSVAVQEPGDVLGTGEAAHPYLLLEAENYVSKTNPTSGFSRVDETGSITSVLGNAILGTNTTASGDAALFANPGFGAHSDKATYRVQFSQAGTYYLYMRYTVFESSAVQPNLTYLNEDSFFVPPDWNKDPELDWPQPAEGETGRRGYGGYIEGGLNSGFFLIREDDGTLINHTAGDEAGRAFYEGNFHWNHVQTSEFLAPTEGTARMRIKYEVTAAQVGIPLDFTISYREGGLTFDAFLFSTDPDLMASYTQFQLDRLLVNPVTKQSLTDMVGDAETGWSYLVLEGEDYDFKSNPDLNAGFTRVSTNGLRLSPLGSAILATNSTASQGGALFGQTSFGAHIDKVTYQVQFAKPGIYYLYMRFSVFEMSGSTSYLNEDSFFVPPAFDKDPELDWPQPAEGEQGRRGYGGYSEGGLNNGFFLIPDEEGTPVNHTASDEAGLEFYEGKFYWNKVTASEFLSPTEGVASAHFQYEVTESMVGKPVEFTISYREFGLTIDAFMFSTNPNLMTEYKQAELDKLVLKTSSGLELTVTLTGTDIVFTWPASTDPAYVLESTDTLPGTAWTPFPDAPTVEGGVYKITIPAATSGTGFYRLMKP